MSIQDAPTEALRNSLRQIFQANATSQEQLGSDAVEFARVLSNELIRRATQ